MFEFPWLKVLPYKGVLILICDWTLSWLECFQLEYCWLWLVWWDPPVSGAGSGHRSTEELQPELQTADCCR